MRAEKYTDDFTMRKEVEKKDKSIEVVFYDAEGRELADQYKLVGRPKLNEFQSAKDDSKVFAKLESHIEPEKYVGLFFVKKSTMGSKYSMLANPFGPSHIDGEMSAVNTMSDQRYYEYYPVTEQVFVDYLRFLQTRNPSHLRQAERGITNGTH